MLGSSQGSCGMRDAEASQTQQCHDTDRWQASDASPLRSAVWGKLLCRATGAEHVFRHELSAAGGLDTSTSARHTLGRDRGCSVYVADADRYVSKNHCVLSCAYSFGRLRVFVEDTSSNGTQVNDEEPRLRRACRELRSGDVLHLTPSKTACTFVFISAALAVAVPPVLPSTAPSVLSAGAGAASGRRVEDEYVIGERLGEGQCGAVHVCAHRASGARRAVKVIHASRLSMLAGQSIEALRAEAEILAGLDHPGIIRIVDTFEGADSLYIVMELVSGGDLFDRVVARGGYPEADARAVLRSLLSALAYMHGKDVVHRDLKPENILLVRRDSHVEVKIADFGLAKRTGGDGLKTYCGTPQYFAPEVLERKGTALGAGRYGASADMWSLGVVLFVLLSGAFPFSQAGLEEELPRGAYSLGGAGWGAVSDQAKHLVARMMELRPERRISAEEALRHPWVTGLAAPLECAAPQPLLGTLGGGRRAPLVVGDSVVAGVAGMGLRSTCVSAAEVKQRIAASKELASDRIAEFDSVEPSKSERAAGLPRPKRSRSGLDSAENTINSSVKTERPKKQRKITDAFKSVALK